MPKINPSGLALNLLISQKLNSVYIRKTSLWVPSGGQNLKIGIQDAHQLITMRTFDIRTMEIGSWVETGQRLKKGVVSNSISL